MSLFQEESWRDPGRTGNTPGEGEGAGGMEGEEQPVPDSPSLALGGWGSLRAEQGACLGAEATQPGPGRLAATGQFQTAWAPNLQPRPLASSARQNKLVRASCCATQLLSKSGPERAPTLAHRWEALATRTQARLA